VNDGILEIAPPRRAFLYIFLIAGVVFLLNGLAVLVFSPIPRAPDSIQPGTMSPAFGVGGLMPIAAGLLCLAGAGWMLSRHRKVSQIAALVEAELPESGSDPESRERLLSALTERAVQLTASLTPFSEAAVSIDLRFSGGTSLELGVGAAGSVSGRLYPIDEKLAKRVERSQECVVLEEEILLDFATISKAGEFLEELTSTILNLPPDYDLSGDIRVYKRDSRRPS
jgi:hypothetical protein